MNEQNRFEELKNGFFFLPSKQKRFLFLVVDNWISRMNKIVSSKK